MAGAGGFLPITVPLASVRSGLEGLFANQSTLAARIVSAQDGALFALVSGLRVPVPKDAGLKSGDAVVLTLTREGGELRLTIKPAPTAGKATPQPAQPRPGAPSPPNAAQPNAPLQAYGPNATRGGGQQSASPQPPATGGQTTAPAQPAVPPATAQPTAAPPVTVQAPQAASQTVQTQPPPAPPAEQSVAPQPAQPQAATNQPQPAPTGGQAASPESTVPQPSVPAGQAPPTPSPPTGQAQPPSTQQSLPNQPAQTTPQPLLNQAPPAPSEGQTIAPQASVRSGAEPPPLPTASQPTAASRPASAPPSSPPPTAESFVARSLPKGVFTGSPVVRLLTTLFTGNDKIAELIGALRALADKEDAEPGRLPETARSEEPAKSVAAIRKWVGVQRSTPEAQLSALPAADAPLEETEVIELAKLRRDLFGKAAGIEREGRAENVFDRITASRVWNLHGLDQPYLFAELPVAPESFWRRAQMHVFGEGGDGKNRFDGPVSVILDLDTEALGAMWATVRTDGRGACSCVVRAAETHAGDAIAAASPELEAALHRAGYPKAEVRVEPWEEERVEALQAMTARLSGLDMEA